jgi:hypothetical protein
MDGGERVCMVGGEDEVAVALVVGRSPAAHVVAMV